MFHENDLNFSGFATQPEKRGTDESPVCSFSIANTESYKDKNGDYQDTTTYVKCVAFGKQAEYLNQHLQKGDEIKVKGKLINNNWTTEDDQKRSELQCKIGQFHIYSSKAERDQLKELRKSTGG